jgi:hypothetical protein
MSVTPEKFVQALATYCRDDAVSDCVSSYISPPGRRASARLAKLSQWFTALAQNDREMVVEAMMDASHATLFGVLCAFDGARTIDDEGHRFAVVSELHGVRQDISSPSSDLHDLLDRPAEI